MKSYHFMFKIGIILLLLLASGCEYDGPQSILKEAQKWEIIFPKITQVLPEEAGSTSEITLVGENFSAEKDKNVVYFNNSPATIKSATTTEIMVYRPAITGDSLTIKVIVEGVIGIGKYPGYKLPVIIEPFGLFLDADQIGAIALDKDENLYALLKNGLKVVRFDHDGKLDDLYSAGLSNLVTDMQVGPGGGLYAVRKNNRIFRVPPTGGEAEEIIKTPKSTDKVEFLDFDANGNMYTAGDKTGLIVYRKDNTIENLGLYNSFNIDAIRVYDYYVYVLASGNATQPAGVYRNKIENETGKLGANELVLNSVDLGDYANATLLSLTFSVEGDMFIGTNYDQTSPILVKSRTGTIAPLYYKLLSPPADYLVWGNGNYLYTLINKGKTVQNGARVIRIDMNKAGAPYFGRNLQ